MVIGTNIGTTSTAILSAMGATSNARRLAAAHVLFNLVTGAVALLMLPLLIALLGVLREWFEQPATPAVMIAMFHTAFNLLGVLLMVPIAPLMLRSLSSRFRTREEEVARPHYLDTNSLAIPDLAIHALRMELSRTQGFAVAALAAANRLPPDEASVEHETSALQALAPAIGNYARQLSGASLPPALVETLAHSLRTLQYQETTAMLMREAVALAGNLARTATRDFSAEIETFRQSVARLAEAADPGRPDFSPGAVSVRLEEAEARYQELKAALLLGGAHARLDIHTMQDWLRLASLERRATEQVAKAARMLTALDEGTSAAEVARNDEAERAGDGDPANSNGT
jgi:phosphate:Na+ symporter